MATSWTTWLMAGASLLLLAAQGCLFGCSAEYWTGKTTMRTELKGPGWYFIDTKDNTIELEDAAFDPTTNSGKIGKLVVRNNASDPITAEIARINAVGVAQLSQVAYLNAVMQGFQGIIGSVGQAAPGLSWLGSSATGGGGLNVGIPTPLGTVSVGTGATTPWVAPAVSAEVTAAQLEAAKLQAEYQARLLAIIEKQQAVATQPLVVTPVTNSVLTLAEVMAAVQEAAAKAAIQTSRLEEMQDEMSDFNVWRSTTQPTQPAPVP